MITRQSSISKYNLSAYKSFLVETTIVILGEKWAGFHPNKIILTRIFVCSCSLAMPFNNVPPAYQALNTVFKCFKMNFNNSRLMWKRSVKTSLMTNKNQEITQKCLKKLIRK